MTLDLTVPSREQDSEYERLRAIIWSWVATEGKGIALRQTTVSDPTFYAGDFRNAGTAEQSFRASTGAHSMTVNGAGNTLSSATVTGGATVGGTLEVTGATMLLDTLDVTGATTLLDTLDVTGATTLLDTLDVTGAVTLLDTLDVTGATTLQSTLDVVGATTLQATLDVTGATTLQDTLDVTGPTTLQSTLDVTDLTTLGALATTGHATLGDDNTDTLTVIGVTTIRNTTPATLVVFNPTLLLATFGIGTKVQGDFTNATLLSRTLLQTSTVNGFTLIGTIPNGTGTASGFQAFNSATPVEYAQFVVSAAVGSINMSAGITSFRLQHNGATKIELNATGVGFLAAAPVAVQTVAAAATDLPTVVTLANNIRTALINFGLCV